MNQNQAATLSSPDQNNVTEIHRQLFGQHKKGILVMLGFTFIQFFFMGYVVDAGELTIKALLDCTNAIRLIYEPNQLAPNDKLNTAAENKLENMKQYKYWAHQNPITGAQPWDFIDAADYDYVTAGENLAYGFTNSQKVCDAWKNSPKHLENIKDPTFEEIGFAVDKANLHQNEKGILVVQMFGSRYDFVPTANQNQQSTSMQQTMQQPASTTAQTPETSTKPPAVSPTSIPNASSNSPSPNPSFPDSTAATTQSVVTEKPTPQVEGASKNLKTDSVYASTAFIPLFLINALPYAGSLSLLMTIVFGMQIAKFKKNKNQSALLKKITVIFAIVTVILFLCYILFPPG